MLEPPGEDGGSAIRIAAYKIRKQNRVYTAVRKGSDLATAQQTNLSRGASDDVIVTDVPRRGEKIMRIIYIYDHRDVQIRDRHVTKVFWDIFIQQGGGTKLFGNWNALSHTRDP